MEIESQLQSLGYEVTSVVNTSERAIQKTEVDQPDLILMGIRIKGEMDGIEAAEVIRNRFGIPVIFSTAYLDQERIDRAKITMPFGYVLKPIQKRDLKVTLEMALYVAKVDEGRRRAESKVYELNKQLSSTLKAIPDLLFEVDNEGQLYQYHATNSENLYESPDEFINNSIVDILPRNAADIVLDAIAKAAETGHYYGSSYSLDLPHGTRWFELSKEKESILKHV